MHGATIKILGISCLLRDLEHCSQGRALFTLWDTAWCINCSAQRDDSAEYSVTESVPSCCVMSVWHKCRLLPNYHNNGNYL